MSLSRPPIAWAVAVLAGFALTHALAVRSGRGTCWLGAMVFALAPALVAWAIATITRAGSNVPTRRPTTTIVDTRPLPLHAQSHLPRHGAGARRLSHCPQQPLAVAADLDQDRLRIFTQQ